MSTDERGLDELARVAVVLQGGGADVQPGDALGQLVGAVPGARQLVACTLGGGTP